MIPPLCEFGGSGPVMHLAVANGFPPPGYRPLLGHFTDSYRVISLPPRPLWPEGPAPSGLASWRDLAADLLDGLRAHDLHDVIALGHSMGGLVSSLAALEEPGRFRALALLDPTFLPPAILAAIRASQIFGLGDRSPIIQGALRRRDRWASPEETFGHWRSKAFFADWPDEALWEHVRGATRPDGDGVTLAWSRQWEARCFRTIPLDTWRIVARLRDLPLPILAIGGEATNTFRPASIRKMRRLAPQADFVTVRGHGHLFPQSAAAETARIIRRWLEERGL
jgi:pimeloyl-ACP methyl ester carboxylesterase